MNHLDSLTPTLVLVAGALINHVCKENKELTARDVMLILSPTVPTLVPILVAMLKASLLAAMNKKEGDGSAAAAGAAATTPNAALAGAANPVGTTGWRVRCAVLAMWQQVCAWLAFLGLVSATAASDMGERWNDEHEGVGGSGGFPTRQIQQVECTPEFMRQLSIYLDANREDTCFYRVASRNQSYKVQQASNIGMTQVWSNVRLQIPLIVPPPANANTNATATEDVPQLPPSPPAHVEIELDELSVNLTVERDGVLKIAGASKQVEKKRVIDLTKITRLSDFIDDEDERLRFRDLLPTSIVTDYLNNNGTMLTLTVETPTSTNYVGPWDFMVVHLIHNKCPNLDVRASAVEAFTMTYARTVLEVGSRVLSGAEANWRFAWLYCRTKLDMFGHTLELEPSVANGAFDYIKRYRVDGSHNSYSYRFNLDIKITEECFPTVFAMLKRLKLEFESSSPGGGTPASTAVPSSPTMLTFTMPTPYVCPQIDASFQQFLVSIQHGTAVYKKNNSSLHALAAASSSTTSAAKVKIYNMCIDRVKTVSTSPNPAYAEYEEKRDQLSKLEKGEQTQFLMAEFLRQSIPPKDLTETSLKPQVKVSLVNEKAKRFDTLYLRELDMRKLANILERFKSSTELFETYGLPNKLGIMLHGEPGTGKTSAIHAIATFLQKNIYYTNLSNVETNEELQMLFDHVQQCSTGGGIIVFEDIDAMTSIVHRRCPASGTGTVSSSVSGTSTPETQISRWSVSDKSNSSNNSGDKDTDKKDNNNPLTLEYLLNLLQGSLTRDGTIFIATTNHKEKLDPALCRVGRFDVDIEMKCCDHFQIQTIYKTFLQRHVPPALLSRIPEDQFTPAEFIFQCVQFIKLDDVTDEVILAPFLEEESRCKQ